MKTLVLLIPLLISGCATTIKDFRETPLTYMAQLPGAHKAMANCLMLRLEESLPNVTPETFRLTTEQHRTSLLVSQQLPAGPFVFQLSPMTEFVLTQTQPKDVLMEFRSRYPAGSHYVDAAKPFIGPCAAQSLVG